MNVLIVVETAVLLVMGVLVAGLLRSYATVLQRLHRLDGGVEHDAAPPFRTASGVVAPPDRRASDLGRISGRAEWAAAHDIAGVGLSGEVVSVRTVAVAHDTVLVFLSSGCSGCAGFWAELGNRRGSEPFGDSRLLVVTKGVDEESAALLNSVSPSGVDLVMSSSAWADYAVPGSPYVVVVDGHTGRVKGEGSGTSLTQVSGLIQQVIGDTGYPVGHHAVVKPRSDADREVDVDRVLLAAGISPGHPSLYPAGDSGIAGTAEGQPHFPAGSPPGSSR